MFGRVPTVSICFASRFIPAARRFAGLRTAVRGKPPARLRPLRSGTSRRSRSGGTSGERRSAVLKPGSYAESSLVSVVSQRLGVALRVSSVARLTADQTVRIDARRNQDHVLD